MQFTTDKDQFQKALASVQGVIDRRGTMPILANVLIQSNGDGLSFTATDLEVSYRGHCPANVSEEGAVTVPAIKLFALVKELHEGELEIQATKKHNLMLKRGEARYTLHGLPADQFPPVPEAEGELVEMESKVLKEMLAKVVFSVASDDLQYHLNSILLDHGEDKPLRMVATDGHRLTLVDRAGSQLTGPAAILIPGKGAREMARFMEGETVQIGISDKVLILKSGDRQLSVRLLDKKFPEYGRIIPEKFQHSFTFNRQSLIDALKRLAVLTSDRFKGMVFKLQAEQAEITFQSPDAGEGREVLPVIECDAPEFPIEVGYNARYLLEPLLAMTGEQVLLEINEPDRPAKLSDPGDPQYFSLVMPMGL